MSAYPSEPRRRRRPARPAGRLPGAVAARRLPRRLLAAVAVLLGLSGLAVPAAAATRGSIADEYVALGDSFAAGPLIFPQENFVPCFRSAVNYPHLVAKALGAKIFRDVTCSGATTAHILTTRQAGLPIQLDAVSARTSLVTLTIGANDIGLAGLGLSCFNALPEPAGVSCKDTQTAGGADRGAQKVDSAAPLIAAALDAIHAKAPRARILVTSYTDYIQPDGCYPIQPVWARDASYIQGLVDRLARVTERVAGSHHAEFVDLITPAEGHDGCQLTQNWANVVVPGTTLGLVPLHPTALGERNFARLVVAGLAGARS
ncbi:SGNH/GDSL hydrolase family protein [Amycolatopsis halotolerans]|uniref:SGNH/GDSL hydrolase family protein n=2 Tax=Amycolatopsis halotolerans TaxID=330083 RepID=A0ABV7QET2_9PSEU